MKTEDALSLSRELARAARLYGALVGRLRSPDADDVTTAREALATAAAVSRSGGDDGAAEFADAVRDLLPDHLDAARETLSEAAAEADADSRYWAHEARLLRT